MRHRIDKLALTIMPKYTLTAFIGWFSKRRMSKILIPTYIKAYNIQIAEAMRPVADYPNLLSFFCRHLKPSARTIHTDCIASPVDGTVSEFGRIEKGTLLQAKGHAYRLEELLAEPAIADRFENGAYITVYLSPADYHRIHMPCDGTLTGWKHVPGTLFPVNPKGVQTIGQLFTKNERLITFMNTEYGEAVFVKVGATIVGSIRTEYGPEYESVLRRKSRAVTDGKLNQPCIRGEEIGRFEFGSTVILLFAEGVVRDFCVQTGQKVRLGEPLAFVRGSA